MNEENKIEEELKSTPMKKLPDLKTLRETKGLTIEDIFLKTRIDPAILDAIENGEFHLLPKPVYAKRFIKIYAETIGTDAEIILAHYQRYLDDEQAEAEEDRIAKAPIASDHNRKPLKRYLLYALPVVAIAAAFIIYAFLNEQEPGGMAQPKATVDEQKEVVPQPAPALKERLPEAVENIPPSPPPAIIPKETTPTPTPPPPPAVIQKETTQAPGAPLNLVIEATEDTWLSIKADNKPPYQVTLKKGVKLSRNAREFFVVDVGNAAGVNITFQGKPLGTLGQKGEVVHLRLPQQ